MATKKSSKKSAKKSKTGANKRAAKKTVAKKAVAKKTSRRKSSSKRELISPRGDKRYVRRDAQGQFIESDDQGRSLAADVRVKAKTKVKSGQGDKGDRK